MVVEKNYFSSISSIMEEFILYWMVYSGIIAIILTIIFAILYIKNKKIDNTSKKTKRYKILLIISIILIIQDIVLLICMFVEL